MADKKPTKADLTAVPIQHLDLEKTETIADLVDGYKHISFQARTLGLCASVLENMMTDPKCTVFFGGAGALTPGGLKKVDRKSTRLNSSHSQISYAVFCLKKKKKTHRKTRR